MDHLRETPDNPFFGPLPSLLCITQKQLEYIFQHSRSRETSLDPEFRSESCKDRVQCMPTAFVIQTLCGGVFGVENFLMQDNENKHKKRVPHFFNIVDGKYVDFTREQMKYRENIRNVKVLNVGSQSILMNQDKEDYYTFLAATQIEKKEALLFQNVKERINSVLSTDLDAYLAAGKKIRLLD